MRIRSDKELALKAINGDWQGGNLLSVLGNNLKSDYDVVLAAVKKQKNSFVWHVRLGQNTYFNDATPVW